MRRDEPCPTPSLNGSRHRAWTLFALALIGASAEAAGQTRVTVLEEADGTAVGMSVIVQAGNAWETERETGLSHLAAEAVAEQVRPRLHPMGGRISVRCDDASVSFTLLLPRAEWRAGATLFLDALFEQPVGEAAVSRAKASLGRRTRAADGGTVGDLRAALAETLYAGSSRWARAPCGGAGTERIEAFSVEDVRRWVRTRFLPTRATAAIAGPVDRTDALRMLRRSIADSELPLLVPAPAADPRSGMRHVEQDAVSARLALAFPFPASTDTEALGLIAHLLLESARPGPDRPELFDIGIELERHGEGGALLVFLVVEPDRAREWAEQVGALMRSIGREALATDTFDSLRRRYRGTRLRTLAAPESRADDAARQLFHEGRHVPVSERIERLSAERIRRAATSLGAPAVVLLGPR